MKDGLKPQSVGLVLVFELVQSSRMLTGRAFIPESKASALKFRAESNFFQSSELSQILGFCSDTLLKWFWNPVSWKLIQLAFVKHFLRRRSRKYHCCCYHHLLRAWETMLMVSKNKIHPCLKEFMMWIGKTEEGEGMEQCSSKMMELTIAPRQRALYCIGPLTHALQGPREKLVICLPQKQREFEVLPKFCENQGFLDWFK